MAKRALIEALKAEKENPAIRPQPRLDAANEITEISAYFNELQELITISSFKGALKGEVYARFCHVEGRLAYISWETIEYETVRSLYENIAQRVKMMRKKSFADYPPYIIEVIRKPGEEGGSQQESFSEEDQEALEKARKALEELTLKRIKATNRNISYAEDLEQEIEDEEEIHQEFEHFSNERMPLQMSNQQNTVGYHNQEIHATRENEIPCINPNFIPRNPFPSFPSNPIPSSNENERQNFENGGAHNSTQLSFGGRHNSYLPIYKWKISFDGKTDGSVISFLKDIGNMAHSQGLNETFENIS